MATGKRLWRPPPLLGLSASPADVCAAQHGDLAQSSLQPLPRETVALGFDSFPVASTPAQRNRSHDREPSRSVGDSGLASSASHHSCHERQVLSYEKSKGAMVASLQGAVSLQVGGE